MKEDNLKLNLGIMIFCFFLFHLFSFLAYQHPWLNSLFFWLIIILAIIFSLYRLEYGFLFLIFEFFSGHEGHLFEFVGLSLRWALFLVIIFIWFVRRFNQEKKNFFRRLIQPKISLFFSIFLLIVFLSFIQGLVQNDPVLAIKDFINYSYFFLIFPLMDVVKNRWFQEKTFKIGKAATIGITLVTIFVFVLFVSGLVNVHGHFYWWWRGTVIGKATDTGTGFFRIVSSAHLLMVPIFLLYLSFLFVPEIKKKKTWFWLAFLSSVVLLINFSRAYFLGIVIGLFFLGRSLPWRRWLCFSLTTILVLFFEFFIIFGLATGEWGNQGALFFGKRIQTVVTPGEEVSSLSRMNILPQLLSRLEKEPIFSQGLGTTVSYFDPVTQMQKSTFHLDWGYLEMWLELGFFGLLFYFFLLFNIFYQGWRKLKELTQIWGKRLIIGLLAGLASLMVATLTGPFLFHPLGIFYVVSTAAIINILKNENSA